jgi:hypothetical protein
MERHIGDLIELTMFYPAAYAVLRPQASGAVAMTPSHEDKLVLDDELSTEEQRFIIEFARYASGARRISRIFRWLGALGIGVAMLAYYILSIVKGWHGFDKPG